MPHPHDHWYAADDRHPRETTEYRHYEWANRVVPESDVNEANKNVLDDDDPAICFVKAYARKPLGKSANKPSKKKIPSNAIDEDDWFENEADNDDDEYGDEEYYSENGYDNSFSDSSEEYYDEEEDGISSDGESEEEDEEGEETSSEDEDGLYDPFTHNLWDKDSHFARHAQYFDMGNQETTNPVTSPQQASSDEEDSEEDETGSESSEYDANDYPRRRRRRRGGQRRRGRRTRRRPTAGGQGQVPHQAQA